MGTKDPRVDAYIAKSAPFAQPILKYLRETVHAVCPDVEETMKWSFPHFMHKGMLCSMAAFTQHAVFGFRKGSLVVPKGKAAPTGMGQLGKITKLSDLPSKNVLTGYIRKARVLNEQGVKVPRAPKRAAPKILRVPADLAAALRNSRQAQVTFEAFSPSHKREYIEWITEAKAPETRSRRLQTAIEWMAEGKPRNWKYMRT